MKPRPPQPRDRVDWSPADVRVAPLATIPQLLAARGIDPKAVLKAAGLSPKLFDDPENRVPFDRLGSLIEDCVRLTGQPEFGLLVGSTFDLEMLGPLGGLMRASATLRDALRSLTLHLETHDRAAVALTLQMGRSEVALGYAILDSQIQGVAQVLDGSIAIGYRILRELCGPAWKSRSVMLSHRAPKDARPWKEFFRARVEFGTEVSVIVFDAKWLDHPLAASDPALASLLEQQIQTIKSTRGESLRDQVSRSLYPMVLARGASATSIARLFGLSERQLRRRLHDEGVNIRQAINDARRKVAIHLLLHTQLAISEIAGALHYSDANAFARAFRGWTGTTATAWRARSGASAEIVGASPSGPRASGTRAVTASSSAPSAALPLAR